MLTKQTAATANDGVQPFAESDLAPSTFLDRLLGAWLRATRSHPVISHVLVAIAITGAVDVAVLAWIDAKPTPAATIGAELVIVLVSLTIPVTLTLLSLRREVRTIFRFVADGPVAATPILLRFVSEELVELQEAFADLRSQGALLEAASVSRWVSRRCFAVTQGRYIAPDGCTPSEFMARYSDFLEAHHAYLARTGRTDSVRINVADPQALEEDIKRFPEAHRAYVEWHKTNGVQLVHVPRDRAQVLSRQARLHGTIDWSFWLDELALAWDYESDGVRMRITFVGERIYVRSAELIRCLLKEARPFPEAP